MSESTPLELSSISDPDVRRAMRAMHQQFKEMLDRQKLEIQAVLEILVEKHLTSIGELRRIMMRLQQGGARVDRIAEAMAGGTHAAAPAART